MNTLDLKASFENFLHDYTRANWAHDFAWREQLEYPLLSGGKRFRAMLCLLSCHDLKGEGPASFSLAAGLEMIHAYSLVHDDLPCMDDDDWRRGRPSLHRRFGEWNAVLVGDALQAEGFHCLFLGLKKLPLSSSQQLAVLEGVSRAIGARGMVWGQYLDMIRRPDVLTIHRHKTGELIKLSLLLGGLCAGYSFWEEPLLSSLGEDLGLWFQLRDDWLDQHRSDQELGKTSGKDLAQGKETALKNFGVEHTQQRMEQLWGVIEQNLLTLFPAGQALYHYLKGFKDLNR